jgi:hypothetical protein
VCGDVDCAVVDGGDGVAASAGAAGYAPESFPGFVCGAVDFAVVGSGDGAAASAGVAGYAPESFPCFVCAAPLIVLSLLVVTAMLQVLVLMVFDQQFLSTSFSFCLLWATPFSLIMLRATHFNPNLTFVHGSGSGLSLKPFATPHDPPFSGCVCGGSLLSVRLQQ